jgi:hypothetical protein
VSKTIAELHSALRAAIADKRLEQQRSIEFYFDSEVAIRTILGFRQLTASNRKLSDLSEDSMVLRALLSSGYLGRVHLLSPHLVELDYFLRSKSGTPSRRQQGDFKAEVGRFLSRFRVEDKFDLLTRAVEAGDGRDDVDALVEVIKTFDVSSFVAVELANGSLQQRYSGLHKAGVLGFEKGDGSLWSDLRRSPVDFYSEVITRATPEADRDRREDAIFRDAVALVQLRKKVLRSDGEKKTVLKRPAVRFYAEADILGKVLREPKIAEDLSYRNGVAPGPIVRPAYYFLLRTYFEALAFPHLEPLFHGRMSITFEELEALCDDLRNLPAEKTIERWDASKFKNRRLAAELEALESLAFFKGILLSYDPPRGMAGFVDRLREMSQLFRRGRFSRRVLSRIGDEMSELRTRLSESTQGLRELFELLEVVEGRVKDLHKRKHDSALPTMLKDVGLVRWGFEVSAAAEGQFAALLRNLLRGTAPAWKDECRALVEDVKRDPDGSDSAVVTSAALWFLELYDHLVVFIDGLDQQAVKHGQALSIEFDLMRAAARLRSDSELGMNVKAELLASLRARISLLADDDQIRFKIGLAYLLAHAASFEEKLFKARAFDAVAREWLKDSFGLASEVRNRLGPERLLRAYAVNHCAYVGTVANDGSLIDSKEAEECMTELLSIRSSRYAFWNYRFVDTVLMPDFRAVSIELEDLKSRRIPKQDRGQVFVRLRDTIKAAFAAYDSVGAFLDRETMDHRARWEALSKAMIQIANDLRNEDDDPGRPT